eukprot:g13959.t1
MNIQNQQQQHQQGLPQQQQHQQGIPPQQQLQQGVPPQQAGGPPHGGYLPPIFGGGLLRQGSFNAPLHQGGLQPPPQAGGMPPHGGFNQPPQAAFHGGGPPPFYQGPPQGHPFLQGAGAVGAPPHWLGPHSAYYINMDHKSRRMVCTNVTKRVRYAMKTSQQYEGPPAQASSQASTILAVKENPVCFADAVIDAFAQESGGVLSLSSDDRTFHPVTGIRVVHPVADWLTPIRMEILLDLLPASLGTVTTYNAARGQEVMIHDLRGGKRSVPHHLVTVRDILRLVVEEEYPKHSTRNAAALAFDGLSLLQKESWLALSDRLVRYYRASTVDPAMPQASEDNLFWSQLSAEQLALIQEKMIRICISSDVDRSTKDAHLEVNRDKYEPELERMPIIKHELDLPHMRQTGTFVKGIYTQFSHTLSKDAGKYLPVQSPKPSARSTDVNSLKSNRIPVRLTTGHESAFTQADLRKPAALCAIDSTGESEVFNSVDDYGGGQPDQLMEGLKNGQGRTRIKHQRRPASGAACTTHRLPQGCRRDRGPSPLESSPVEVVLRESRFARGR